MRRFLFSFFLCFLLLPIGVNAKYNATNLDEALNDEVIVHDFSNYKETDDQVIIYLFRGNGCQHCRAFLKFLNSIVPDYGKYFKLESYEIWDEKNKDNKALLNDVAIHMGYDPTNNFGIPFIIIGDKVFDVYSSNYDNEIKSTIIREYQKKDRYDVLVDMKIKKGKSKINFANILKIIYGLSISGILVISIINFNKLKKINLNIENMLNSGRK